MTPEIRVLADAGAVAGAAAELLAEAARPGANIVLAGGSTPAEAYRRAAAARADWRGVKLWLGDDRAVPPDDERSNARMVSETLLAPLAPDARPELLRVMAEDGEDTAAEEYELLLREEVGDVPSFDLVLLGLGPDAHTASLFPGKPAAEERDRLVVGVPEPGMAPLVPRVTMTLPVFNAALLVVFLVAGADKAAAVRRAFGDPPDPASPAAHVRPGAGRLLVLCDEAAAGEL